MPQIPYILSVVTFLPLVGAGLILLARLFNKAGADGAARWIALLTTLVTLAVSVVLVANFDPSSAAYQFVERYVWFVGAQYHMGVDGISILFVLLTAFLMPICILASWTTIKDRVVDYMIAFLVLETLVIGVFTSLDLFLFYMFFEGTLVPMFIIIGVWGGANRIYASYKFFLYTLLGSVLMLLAMLWMAAETGTTSIPALKAYAFSPTVQPLLWLAFFASFAVKMPMWPVHTWLPDAHVQAPTAGSVLISQETRLPDGGRLSLSRADFVTSGGVRLEKRGVTPDVAAPVTLEDRLAGRDPGLDAALAALAEPRSQPAMALQAAPAL